MSLARTIKDYLLPPPIADAGALGRFLTSEASRLAQSATYEYTRNTLAYTGRAAFADDEFNRAFRLCRWEAYAAVLSDFTVVTQGRLRPAAADPAALNAALIRLNTGLLEDYPRPDHRPAGWGDIGARLALRLNQAATGDPAPVAEVMVTSARRIYQVVPVHSEIRAEDHKVIESAIVFGGIAVFDRFDKRLRARAVITDLLQGGGGG